MRNKNVHQICSYMIPILFIFHGSEALAYSVQIQGFWFSPEIFGSDFGTICYDKLAIIILSWTECEMW